MRYVTRQETSNQSLRARFYLPENKSVVVSQVIAVTVEAGLIKAEVEAGSRKFAPYIPFWA